MNDEVCPRCQGTGTFESAKCHPRKNRGMRVKCDCTFGEFGRRREAPNA